MLTHETLLPKMIGRGLTVASVLDVGAGSGWWTRFAMPLLPQARFHMVDAFHHWERDLAATADGEKRVSHSIAVCGPRPGIAHFHNDIDHPHGGDVRSAPGYWPATQVRLDDEVERMQLPGPYLLKVNVFGQTSQVLAGARKVLKNCGALIVTCYGLEGPDGGFAAMARSLNGSRMHMMDFCRPLWRPGDGALWQTDVVFLPADAPECRARHYF